MGVEKDEHKNHQNLYRKTKREARAYELIIELRKFIAPPFEMILAESLFSLAFCILLNEQDL